MVVYIENLWEYTQHLLELIREVSKVAGYITYKNQLYFYIVATNMETKIKTITPFTTAERNEIFKYNNKAYSIFIC